MANDIMPTLSAVTTTQYSTGPGVGTDLYFEGVRSGLTVRVVQVNEHVCGYVKLPEGHPWLLVEDVDAYDLSSVHGGITYRYEGWVGFDTAHGSDLWPSLMTRPVPSWRADNPRVWTAELFMTELERLAHEAASNDPEPYCDHGPFDACRCLIDSTTHKESSKQ